MGAGKSTVGRLLAERLGLPFIDTDQAIEDRVGRSVAQVFASETEQWFRQLESDVIAEVLQGPDAVVALGGGALGDPATTAALEWTDVVLLEAEFSTILARLKGDESRPLMNAGDPRALYEERREAYRRAANLVVKTDERSPEDVAAEIAATFDTKQESETSPNVFVEHGSGSYPVIVGRDLLDSWPEEIALPASAERAFVISQRALRAYAGPIRTNLSSEGLEVRVLEIPDGERSKSVAVADELYRALAADSANRHDLVISVGGGVVSDLAGFVASTYARGLSVVHVPTSLLGQVDAAVGGKTGVNLDAGKNLVGTFHQPLGVVADVTTLAKLPPEEFTSGMAEVLKYGFISDRTLLDMAHLSRDSEPDDLVGMVSRSVRIKARIVAEDEREGGLRAVLNYGHTFGHAIETLSDYSVRHGEAVAVGMMAAAHLAHVQGRIGEAVVRLHRDSLSSAGLPVTARLELGALIEVWRRDKKYDRGVRFVLLDGVGQPVYGVEATEQELAETLRRVER